MNNLILGKSLSNYRNHSQAYITPSGKIGIRRKPVISCRNFHWQKAQYERCMATGEWAPHE